MVQKHATITHIVRKARITYVVLFVRIRLANTSSTTMKPSMIAALLAALLLSSFNAVWTIAAAAPTPATPIAHGTGRYLFTASNSRHGRSETRNTVVHQQRPR